MQSSSDHDSVMINFLKFTTNFRSVLPRDKIYAIMSIMKLQKDG